MMKRIIKKGLFALVLMLGMTFAAPQQMMAGKNPFGDRGWICAGTQEIHWDRKQTNYHQPFKPPHKGATDDSTKRAWLQLHPGRRDFTSQR